MVLAPKIPRKATTAEAIAGVNDTYHMTPALVAAMIALISGGGIYTLVETEAELVTALGDGDPLIAIIGNITLTADRNVAGDTTIKVIPGFTFDKDAYSLIVSPGAILTEDIAGGGALDYQRATGYAVQLGAGAQLLVKGKGGAMGITDTVGAYYATPTERQSYRGVTVNLPNRNNAAFRMLAGGELRDINLVGGGTSCYAAVSMDASSDPLDAHNVTLSGTWSTSSPALELYGASARTIIFDSATDALLQLKAGIQGNFLSDLQSPGAGLLDLTIDSGARARVTSSVISGTLTNNDPDGSEVVSCIDGSGNQILDQRIGIGRYDDATLDATLNYLVGYYDFTEDVPGNMVFRNLAPNANKQPMPFTGGPTINTDGPDGAGITLADINDFGYVTAIDSVGPYAMEFSMAAWIAPNNATPTTNHSLINLTNLNSTTLGVYIGINATSGFPYLYVDGGQRIVGVSNPFTAGVFSLAVMRYKFVSGTLTFELFIDNVSIGTSTFAMIGPAGYVWSVALWAFAAGLGFIGKVSAAQFWNRGLSDAEVNALYNGGPGKFLVGA